MVIPNKSFILSKSLIGIGAIILEHLTNNDHNKNIDMLYEEILNTNQIDFKEFSMSCAFLYAVGIVETNNDIIRIIT